MPQRVTPVVLVAESAPTINPAGVRVAEATPAGATPVAPGEKPGRFRIRIISAGEGSSGYYPPTVLEQAAKDRIFPAGLHCYLDHAAAIARGVHGERSVRDLAAVLTGDAVWNSAEAALDAEVEVFATDAARLRALAPYIGMSISAMAEVAPDPKGGKPTITRLVAAESVDFVVQAGRGGAILDVLESAGAPIIETTANTVRDQLDRALTDQAPAWMAPDGQTMPGEAWVRDFDPDKNLVWFRQLGDERLWQQGYSLTGGEVTLTGAPVEVRAVTTYVPVQAGQNTTTQEGAPMPEISQAELDRLRAAEAALTEAQQATEAARNEAREARDAAARTIAAQQEARDAITAATTGEAPALVGRVTRTLLSMVGESVPDGFGTKIAEAVAAEKAYLAALTGGDKLQGFGPSTDTLTESATPTRRVNAYGRVIQEG